MCCEQNPARVHKGAAEVTQMDIEENNRGKCASHDPERIQVGGVHMPFCNTIKIQFDRKEQAVVVKSALEVDKELQPKKVTKTFEIDGSCLYVHIKSTEWRMLRVATSSFYDMAMVAVQCIDEFGE